MADTPAGFPYAAVWCEAGSPYRRNQPLLHLPLPAPVLPINTRRIFPEKLPAPDTGEPAAFREFFCSQKTSLSACFRRTDRKAVFVCRESGMFSPDVPGCVFLEFVADLERTAYAFPRPRIAGGAKHEGNWDIF